MDEMRHEKMILPLGGSVPKICENFSLPSPLEC
jgi:hypothetical protein